MSRVAVIGEGVEIKKSSIIGADRGLFASRAFSRNEVITEYDGEVISTHEASARRARNGPGHLKTLLPQFAVLDGNIVPEAGRGGGSFANDIGFDVVEHTYTRNHPRHNAVYTHRVLPIPSKRTGIAVLGSVWLKAMRDIREGEEIFVSYGKGFWAAAATNEIIHKLEC